MTKELPSLEGPVCALPKSHKDRIVIGHGSGGKMTADLIRDIFYPPLSNPALLAGNDAGVVQLADGSMLAISTDAHVVSPLFFPGGDIGKLAICGTVNDVAMVGAKPLYLTASFILEEGLELSILESVVQSMKSSAEEAGVEIISGDTKVVAHGEADGLYISTTGVGELNPGLKIGGAEAKPGDLVIISGTIGEHGIAVLEARGELGFESNLESDTAPLNHLVAAMLTASKNIHVLRDPTRGGVATALNEISRQSGVGIILEEDSLPILPAVAAACEMLGFDPLYIANEGKLLAIVSQEDVENVLAVMRKTRYGENAAVIGVVEGSPQGRVLLKTVLGSTRIVDVLAGEMLPRIC
ncbi:MAG: hydrogenase expression/formation protein HypE [Anaerolineales bacterium]|nr:hydrogenase expression/formation protein HypE [Anaerolineales bacterium]